MLPPTPTATWLLLSMLTGIAAITDLRHALVPNWLSLPPLLLAPLVQGLLLGPGALGGSLLGLAVCGAVPTLIFARGGMGGGDVKLLAAIGAIAGPRLGLELQLCSYMLATLAALCVLTLRGRLLATIARTPRAVSAGTAASALEIRLGPAIALACQLLLLGQWVAS